MTNNQIIRNEAARLDPATLHAIATAHHTPDEIAAIAAACKTTDENGNEQPATVADVEIMLAADELHTFDHWKKEGKSVKKGEKHLVCCYLWKYTTKPSKEQREKAAAEGKEAAPDPHYYPTKSHLFSCLQVESSKPAPARAVCLSSTSGGPSSASGRRGLSRSAAISPAAGGIEPPTENAPEKSPHGKQATKKR